MARWNRRETLASTAHRYRGVLAVVSVPLLLLLVVAAMWPAAPPSAAWTPTEANDAPLKYR